MLTKNGGGDHKWRLFRVHYICTMHCVQCTLEKQCIANHVINHLQMHFSWNKTFLFSSKNFTGFVPKGPYHNDKSFVYVAWRIASNKPLLESIKTRSLTSWLTKPPRVNSMDIIYSSKVSNFICSCQCEYFNKIFQLSHNVLICKFKSLLNFTNV